MNEIENYFHGVGERKQLGKRLIWFELIFFVSLLSSAAFHTESIYLSSCAFGYLLFEYALHVCLLRQRIKFLLLPVKRSQVFLYKGKSLLFTLIITLFINLAAVGLGSALSGNTGDITWLWLQSVVYVFVMAAGAWLSFLWGSADWGGIYANLFVSLFILLMNYLLFGGIYQRSLFVSGIVLLALEGILCIWQWRRKKKESDAFLTSLLAL